MNRTTKILFSALLGGVLLFPLSALAQERGWLARETARDYRKAARYPEWSRVLEAGARDPLVDKRTPTKISSRGPEGAGPTLTVWSKKVSFEHPAPVYLFARLEGQTGGPHATVITGEVEDSARQNLGNLAFFDDGVAPDKLAGDGLYTGRFIFDEDYRPELAENVLVKIQATLPDRETRYATAGFLYSRPYAKLTGRYRDRVKDGNLVISARVRVREAGRFHLAGTLHSRDGEPIGTAQTAVELAPGRHWIDLTFYGLMFHDRQIAGPYRLGSVALATTHAMPNALADLVENAYVTRSLPTKSFTAKPFGHPDLLEAATRLEVEAERSGARLDN